MEFLIKRALDMMPGYIAYMIKKRLSEICYDAKQN